MALVSIETDISEVLNTLDGFEKERPKLRKTLLRTATQKTRQKIKRSYGELLHKRSGNLYKSIKYTVWRNGTKAKIYPTEKYGFMLAKGYTVEPKTEEFLTFKIGDKWIRTYGPITVAPRDWAQPPAERYLRGAEIDRDLEEKLEKEVAKIEARYAKKGITK